jgi:hypothetical protein
MLNRRSTSAAGALVVWLFTGCGGGEHSEFFSPMDTSSGSQATGTGGDSTAASGSGSATTSTGDATSGSTTDGASTTGSGDASGTGPTSGPSTSGSSAGGSSSSGSGGATSGQGGAGGGSTTGSGGSTSGSGGVGSGGGSGGAGMNAGAGGSTGTSGAGGIGAGGSAGSGTGSAGAGGRAGGGGAGAGGATGTPGAGGFGGGFGGKGGAGGGSGGIGTFCSSNNSCQPNLYCKKTTCALDVLGRCAARPSTCGGDEAPGCGCDGITYFNPCLAAQNGQSIGSTGACGITAMKCVPGEKTCEVRKSGYCGVILEDNDECSIAKPSGQCWVLPEQCLEFDDHFNACNGGSNCIHTCDAVKSEEPVYPVSNCH